MTPERAAGPRATHTSAAGTPAVPPLASILRRYCFAYTASHDPSVCDDIMVDDYTLYMGEFVIRGRDDNYKPAAEKQYRQFPGLGMSVHDLLITPDRAALRFSEHGRSLLTGTSAAWSGVSLYHWNGADRLVDCRVEQDYYARRRQLRSGQPNAIDLPAHDPWNTPIAAPDAGTESVVRRWLQGNGIAELPLGCLDDEPVHDVDRIVLAEPQVDVLDCFAGNGRAAFHVVAEGVVTEWPSAPAELLGAPVSVYYSGLAEVSGQVVTGARVISDRLGAERRMLAS